MPSPHCRLRTATPTTPATVVTINALLVSTGGGLDQSASPRNRTQLSYVDDGCWNSSRGIFLGSHRPGAQSRSAHSLAAPLINGTCDAIDHDVGESAGVEGHLRDAASVGFDADVG